MAIEVVCTNCYAKLRVPDEALGAQAKCPHCENVFDVDDVSDETMPPRPPQNEPLQPEDRNPFAEAVRDPAFDAANPYASPKSDEAAEPFVPGPIELGRVDAGMALQLAFELLKSNIPILLLTHCTFLLISFAVSSGAETAAQNGQQALGFVLNFGGTLFQWFMSIGIIIITLGVARGQRVEFGSLFAGGPYFVRMALYNVLFGLMVILGLLLFIVPGIYLALKFWPAGHFIVDRDCNLMKGFELAGQYTDGNKGACFVMFLIAFAVFLAGLLLFCVGFLFAYPLVTQMYTVAYLMMTRQQIHRPAA